MLTIIFKVLISFRDPKIFMKFSSKRYISTHLFQQLVIPMGFIKFHFTTINEMNETIVEIVEIVEIFFFFLRHDEDLTMVQVQFL